EPKFVQRQVGVGLKVPNFIVPSESDCGMFFLFNIERNRRKDLGTRLEPGSHKKNQEEINDNDDDEDDIDNHNDHALIKTRKTGSSETSLGIVARMSRRQGHMMQNMKKTFIHKDNVRIIHENGDHERSCFQNGDHEYIWDYEKKSSMACGRCCKERERESKPKLKFLLMPLKNLLLMHLRSLKNVLERTCRILFLMAVGIGMRKVVTGVAYLGWASLGCWVTGESGWLVSGRWRCKEQVLLGLDSGSSDGRRRHEISEKEVIGWRRGWSHRAKRENLIVEETMMRSDYLVCVKVKACILAVIGRFMANGVSLLMAFDDNRFKR
ncbi:hypothetical protein Tco_0684158, partial [Tanacetum coccineum]